MGSTLPRTAIFLNIGGNLLGSPSTDSNMQIDQEIIICIDRYLPHIRLYTSTRRVNPKGINSRALDAAGDFDRDSVHFFINYTNYISHKCLDLGEGVVLDTEEQDYLDGLPASVLDHATTIRDDGGHPYFLNLEFTTDSIASIRGFQGTPLWAQDFAEQIKTGKAYAVIDGGELAKKCADFIAKIFTFNANSLPMDKFYQNRKMERYIGPGAMIHKPKELESYDFQARTVFLDHDEYVTVMGAHILAAREVLCSELEDTCDHPCLLRLSHVANSNDRFYIGFLPLSEDCSKRPSAGAPVEIEFSNEQDEQDLVDQFGSLSIRPEKWHGIITTNFVSNEHQKFASMVVMRPWDPKRKQFSSRVVHTVDTRGIPYYQLADAIEKDVGNTCEIEIRPEDKVYKSLLRAANDLASISENNDRNQWNETINTVLLGSRIDKLPPQDIFRAFRDEFPDITAIMRLNQGQKIAVEAMENSPGGIHLIQGPPGTGKTEIVRQIFQPFIRSKTSCQALFITSANSVVNSFAQSMDEILRRLDTEQLLPPDVYILRVHTETTEMSIQDIASGASQNKMSLRSDKIEGLINWDELDECTQFVTRKYIDETRSRVADPKYAAIKDKRVLLPHLSVAEKMLEVTGVKKGPHTHSDEERFSEFRTQYQDYCKGVVKDREIFERCVKDAQDYTLQNARVLIATTANGGLPHILNTVKDSLDLIVHDEAPRANEVSLLPYFAQRFSKDIGLVMLGDWLQLRPIVMHTAKQNIFALQESISFAQRCFENGISAYGLLVQHRMVPDLCDMANELTYKNKLITHESAMLENRPLAIQFQKRVGKRFTGDYTSKMIVDAKPCAANRTEYDRQTMSRFNHTLVSLASTVVVMLLDLTNDATIGLITPYTAQKNRHDQAIQGMKKKGIDVSKVTNITVDGAQGEEYDYVFYVVLCGGYDSGLGFQADARRNNVATTRARDGFIMIADIDTTLKNDRHETTALSRTINHLKKHSSTVDFKGTFPKSPFYQP